jgi:hypothetical protein
MRISLTAGLVVVCAQNRPLAALRQDWHGLYQRNVIKTTRQNLAHSETFWRDSEYLREEKTGISQDILLSGQTFSRYSSKYKSHEKLRLVSLCDKPGIKGGVRNFY